ncbi:MAG: hypothetical protein FWH24_01315 [Oscillospiraceae bacterium]|nr:hypothetical protein [Oscillospiraceae bacterium]
MSENREHLKKLLEIYGGRLKLLKEFKAVSGNIKKEIEAKGEEAIDIIDDITQKREALLEKIKEADMAARHCESLIAGGSKKAIKDIKSAVKNNEQLVFKQNWAVYMFKILTEYKSVKESIKAADKKNTEAVKLLMEAMKTKLQAIKKNKKMMNKFADGFNAPHIGTLMNEKR